ncbi:MAG: hypothetical protein KJ799_12850 [Bacteroidetes bacterium]|nr:hypothetical protein [Bacteroidota bacterium]
MTFKDDPRWIKARFNSICSCSQSIKKGDDIFYYPKSKTAICKFCGESASKQFNLEAQDEQFFNSQFRSN